MNHDHKSGNAKKDNSLADKGDKHKKHQAQPAQDSGLSREDAETLARQVAELTEALQRERADIMNVRRRHDEQMTGLKEMVKASVIRDLLPIIDNFERALRHVPAELTGNDYVKGVQGVVKQFEKTLGDIGVQRTKTVGETFDPKYHEAVSMDEGDGSEEVVSEELQAGYVLGEEVIRPAMVKVKMQ